jgi:hypothetical protein
MSEGFMTLTKSELLKVALGYGAEVEEGWTKKEITDELEGLGVTWQDHLQFVKMAEEAKDLDIEDAFNDDPPEDVPSGERVLLRMTRKNPTFEIRGGKFTRERPFAFVSEDDAQWILDNEEGFRPATPKEVKEFYGK